MARWNWGWAAWKSAVSLVMTTYPRGGKRRLAGLIKYLLDPLRLPTFQPFKSTGASAVLKSSTHSGSPGGGAYSISLMITEDRLRPTVSVARIRLFSLFWSFGSNASTMRFFAPEDSSESVAPQMIVSPGGRS